MINYKFRLLPTKAQQTIFYHWLEECRMLHNNFLDQRKTGWEKNKKSFGLYEQLNQLPKLKRTYPKLKTVHSQVLQNVGVKVDLAYQAFFHRIKKHEIPGYPRFKSFGRYDSFCYPGCIDISLGNDSIRLPKIGKVNCIFHRKIKGNLKTVTVKRSHDKWYLFIVTDFSNIKKVAKNSKTIAIDVGIKTFATLSNGKNIENPRFFETKQKSLAKSQRKFQKFRDNKNKLGIKKSYRAIGKIHEKITNSRQNFLYQTVNKLISSYGTIIIEDINANEMLKKHWCNKQILDAAWGNFMKILTYKAECAGRKLIKVNPAYTSQTCSKCGTRVLHELKDRVFNCSCGHSQDRDANAAQNILTLGLQSFGLAKAKL